jgi:hypothetical protein
MFQQRDGFVAPHLTTNIIQGMSIKCLPRMYSAHGSRQHLSVTSRTPSSVLTYTDGRPIVFPSFPSSRRFNLYALNFNPSSQSGQRFILSTSSPNPHVTLHLLFQTNSVTHTRNHGQDNCPYVIATATPNTDFTSDIEFAVFSEFRLTWTSYSHHPHLH